MTKAFARILLGGLLLMGCDGQSPERGTAQVLIDVRPLVRSSGAEAAVCVSVAREVVVRVEDSDGETRTYRQALTLEETMLRVDVEAAPGEARFGAEVVSTNETLLYSGTATATVEEGFSVTVPLVKRAPVLQVCPASVLLDVNSGAGVFVVANRGVGVLQWQAVPPAAPCGRLPCLAFDESSGALAGDDLERVFVVAQAGFAGGPAEIRSPVGSVLLDVRRQ